jgi:hypothetical protein
MPKRVRIGDVVEIQTKRGLVYAHYVLNHDEMGALLKLAQGFFEQQPGDFAQLMGKPARFVAFFPLGAAINRKIFKVVGNIPVSDADEKLPQFIASGHIDRKGCVHNWLLKDNDRTIRLGRMLRKEHRSLPHWEIINDTLLIERLEDDWSPEIEMQRIESRGQGDAPPWGSISGIVRRLFG